MGEEPIVPIVPPTPALAATTPVANGDSPRYRAWNTTNMPPIVP